MIVCACVQLRAYLICCFVGLQESREAFFVALRRKGDVTLEDIEG